MTGQPDQQLTLSGMTSEQLRRLAALVASELKQREHSALEAARSEIRAIAARVGVPLAQLMAVKPRATRGARFGCPDNPALTWSGIGRQPRWLRDRLASGQRLDSFRLAA